MVLRDGRFGPFLACTNYPRCNTILNLDKQRRIQPPKTPPLETDLACPKCGAPLYLRTGKRGLWLGCSKFPKCRGRLPWAQLDPATGAHWEQIMEQHLAAHPQVTLTMTDGTPVNMMMSIDEIIASAEEKGLLPSEEEQKKKQEITS